MVTLTVVKTLVQAIHNPDQLEDFQVELIGQVTQGLHQTLRDLVISKVQQDPLALLEHLANPVKMVPKVLKAQLDLQVRGDLHITEADMAGMRATDTTADPEITVANTVKVTANMEAIITAGEKATARITVPAIMVALAQMSTTGTVAVEKILTPAMEVTVMADITVVLTMEEDEETPTKDMTATEVMATGRESTK